MFTNLAEYSGNFCTVLDSEFEVATNEPVTSETLAEYGSDEFIFYKIDNGKYYMEF